jgi:hypothetical protein
MAGLIKDLFDQVTLNERDAANVDHSSHFFLGGENLKQAVRQLNIAIAAQLTQFPLASSSGGFTFSTNPRGEIETTSTTFGPLFAERAVTIGRRQLNLGFTIQGTSYDGFDGQSLDPFGEGLRFISQHNDCCPATDPNRNPPAATDDFTPPFERDLLLSTLRAKIQTQTTAFFVNYGVTDRFDIGGALPIVNVSIDARVDGEILRLGTGDTNPTHSFDASGARTTFRTGDDSATGLGDILLRAKYTTYRTTNAAFAGALDLRLPTGDKDNLLGTGATQAHLFFIGSGEYGRLSPHVNIGYTFSSGETSELASSASTPGTLTNNGVEVPGVTVASPDLSVPDEFNYTFGVSVAATPRITVGFDMRGRSVLDVPKFVVADTSYINRGPGTLPQPTFIASDEFALEPQRGNYNQVLGVLGGKFNVWEKFLINATLLWSMTNDGLKPKPTPVIGFDYVF